VRRLDSDAPLFSSNGEPIFLTHPITITQNRESRYHSKNEEKEAVWYGIQSGPILLAD
jgi:hypothetical protein